MKLLVTGGAGYIGSVVTSQLLESGHDVVVFDDLSKGHEEAIPEGAGFVRGSLLDAVRVNEVLSRGFDGVVHFAALSLVGESVEHPEKYYKSNVCGTLNLLEGMVGGGVGCLVFSSTAAVYGEPEQMPITETETPLPTNPYGASKLAADRLIGAVAEARGLSATSLRYFNVAGSRGHFGEDHDPETHLIPLALRVASGEWDHLEIYGTDYDTPDGTAVRDYIHVEDLGRAHILALDGEHEGHRIYNLGNGEGFSVREVIETAREVTGADIKAVEAPRRPRGPANARRFQREDSGRARLET